MRADLLRGREVWHTVTDTTVLAGPRSPAGAVRLLDQVRCPALTRIRQRLIAATHDAPSEPSATTAALGSLLQWPYRARTALVHDIACAVDAAFQGSLLADRPEVSRTLGWVLALTLAHPGDPLVLAPMLLRVRRLPAGSSFVLPAGWPFARLTGAAVGVGAGEEGLLQATLGGDHGDVTGFVCTLERQPSRSIQPPVLPDRARTARGRSKQQGSDPLSRALELARQIAALHPQLSTSADTIDLRDRSAASRGASSRAASSRAASSRRVMPRTGMPRTGTPGTGGLPRLIPQTGIRRGIG